MALAIEAEARPADAIEFGEGLRNGAHGISPVRGGAPTTSMGTSAATRVLPNRQPPTAATNIAPRTQSHRAQTPRATRPAVSRPAPPPRTREPVRAAREQPRRQPRTARRRFVALVLFAILFAAIVAAAVAIASGTSNTAIHLRQVVGHDVQSAIKSFQDLIGNNTK
jgi:hypothetical protein